MKAMALTARCLAVLSGGALPLAAQAAEQPLRMSPSSNWVVDYADDSCALRRAFRSADEKAVLELRQFEPGDAIQVLVASDTMSRTARVPKVRFEPDTAWHAAGSSVYARYGGEAEGVLYRHSLRPNGSAAETAWAEADRDARERSITGLAVADTFSDELLLETGELHEPMKAMRVCVDELLTHWGIDAAAQRTLSRRARPLDLAGVSDAIRRNWPTDMARDGRSAMVQVRLIVDASGKPTDCRVQLGMSHRQYEKSTCNQLMWNARFEPALDADGKPIASYYTTVIVYHVG